MTTPLPANWCESTLDAITVRISNGCNLPQENKAIGYPISRIETIWNESIDARRVKYVHIEDSKLLDKYVLNDGDILFSHINSDYHLGKTARYSNTPPIFIHGINLLLIRVVNGICSKFVNYQFKYKRSNGEFVKVAQRAVNQSSINQKTLKSFTFVIPPLAEQHRIVDKIEELFTELDKGIESLNKARKQLKVYRQSLLKHAFEGKLTEQWRLENADKQDTADQLLAEISSAREVRYLNAVEQWKESVERWKNDGSNGRKPAKPSKVATAPRNTDRDDSDLPTTWKQAFLAELILNGPTNGYSPKSGNDATGTLSLKLTATTSGRMILTDNSVKRLYEKIADESKYWLSDGDLLVQRANSIEHLGATAIYRGEENKYIYPDLMMRVRFTDEDISHYVWHYLNSHTARMYFHSRATGIAGSMPKISGSVLKETPIPMPPLGELEMLVEILEPKLDNIESTEEEIDKQLIKLASLRQSILKKAFSGQLVAQDPDDEPASILLERITQEKAAAGTKLKEVKGVRKSAAKKTRAKKKKSMRKAVQ